MEGREVSPHAVDVQPVELLEVSPQLVRVQGYFPAEPPEFFASLTFAMTPPMNSIIFSVGS